MVYYQSYNPELDEMMNVPFDSVRLGEFAKACVYQVYDAPVPWRRVVGRDTGKINDAPDSRWYWTAQRETFCQAAQANWFCEHPNLMPSRESR